MYGPCPDGAFCPGWEIDVFENKYDHDANGNPSYHHWANLQANGLSDPPCYPCFTNYKWDNSDPTKEFHTYTLAWTPDSATWFIDGNEIRTQKKGIPYVKMNMILNTLTYGTGQTNTQGGSFEVDYVRVYRPSGRNYAVNYVYDNNVYVWSDYTDAVNSGYAASFEPYMTNDNYEYTPAGLSTTLLDDLTAGTVVDRLNPDNNEIEPMLYFTPGDGNLFEGKINPVANAPAHVLDIDGPIANGLSPTTNLSSNPATGAVFFKGADNRLWSRSYYNNGWHSDLLDPLGNYPSDVLSDIVWVPANGSHPERVYYRNNSNVLCYFEWCQSSTVWHRHVTLVNNVAGSIAISSYPAGAIFYRGADNRVWNISTFIDGYCSCNSAPANDWVFSTMGNPNDNAYSDCLGHIVVEPVGKYLYYQAFKYLGGLQFSFPLMKMEVSNAAKTNTGHEDVQGSIRARLNPEGLTEVYYVGTEGKLHTYYERPAPLYDGQIHPDGNNPQTGEKLYLGSTLDMFSIEGDYRIANFLALSNTDTKIFCLNSTRKAVAYYERRRCGCVCPAITQECNNDDTYQNGLQMRLPEIQKEGEGEIELRPFPNPSSGLIHLSLATGALVTVTDIMGRQLYNGRLAAGAQEINLSGLSSGFYILSAASEGGKTNSCKIAIHHP